MHMSALPSKLSQKNGNTSIREKLFFVVEHVEFLLQLSGGFVYLFFWLFFNKYRKFNMAGARTA